MTPLAQQDSDRLAREAFLDAAGMPDFGTPPPPRELAPPGWLGPVHEADEPAPVFVARLATARAGVQGCEPVAWHDLVAELTTHEVGEKSGAAWMPARIEPGPRRTERVRAITALALDVEAKASGDHVAFCGPLPPDLDEFQERLDARGWRAVVHTTHSHEAPTDDDGHTLGPRYRAVFPLAREVAPDELRPLALRVARELGIEECADTAAMEPARLFFLPRCPAERQHLARGFATEGAPLPVDELLREASELALPVAARHAPADLPAPQGNRAAPSASAAAPVVEPRLVAELRSALNTLPVDDYATWIACGQRLKPLGDTGCELWTTWSQQSKKWRLADALRWDGFTADRTGPAAIFAEAQRLGWVNPASRGAQAAPAGGESAPPWRKVEIADLDEVVPSPQRWLWAGYIPAGALTLFGAHGGAGKSMLALVMGVSVAMGLPLFGVPTESAPVVFFSAEDDAATVRRRLATVLRVMGVAARDLADRLHILDATDCAAELAAMMPARTDPQTGEVTPAGMRLTATGSGLAAELRALPAALLIVDNASDTYAGNEIARQEVRAFVRELARMVRPQGCAVVLLSHVSKGTSRGEHSGSENYSGSTAWHNSARSRLFLEREKDGAALVLKHEKSNYGPLREPLRLTWPADGIPTLDAQQPVIAGTLGARSAHLCAVLGLVHEFNGRGESISTATTSRTHAGKLLRLSRDFPPRLPDAELFELLRSAERAGLLERESYPGPDRKRRERWRLTPAGCGTIGVAATAATAATSEVPALGALAAASDAAPAATAATSPPGGVGGTTPHTVAAQVPARPLAAAPDTDAEVI